MMIRAYQAGDDAAQVSIYNEAAADLPRFKPATLDEVRRRSRDPAYDASSRFVAVENGRAVGYLTFQHNGRISFPWLRRGHEALAEPLLQHGLQEMKQRGFKKAFAAYRGDWTAVLRFLEQHGFQKAREMVNFVLDIVEMPTPSSRPNGNIYGLEPSDLPQLLEMGQGVIRTQSVAELEQVLFHNPYYRPDCLFALRAASSSPPLAVGIVVANPSYASPRQVDAAMPCFWLGAFGTEHLTIKRINGLVSFVTLPGKDVNLRGLDLLGHAAMKLQDTEVETFAAQVPSDAPHLLQMYTRFFRRQGSFPILERTL